jgi:hypothetical protein
MTFARQCVHGLIGALAGLAGQASHATTTYFIDPASFAAASLNVVSYGFAAIAPPAGSLYLPGATTVGPATFTSNGSIFAIGANGGYGNYGVAKLDAQIAPPASLIFNVALSGSATAVSFNVGSYIGAFGVDVTVNGTEHFGFTTPAHAGVDVSFVGFTSTTPISTLSFKTVSNPVNNGGGYAGLDITAFRVGDAAPVPEPQAAGMLLSGLLTLALWGRRRQGVGAATAGVGSID